VKRPIFGSVFEADFAEITVYLGVEGSVKLSANWENAVIRLVELLQKFPGLGRPRLDLHPDGVRSLRVKEFPNYLVFYQLRGNEIIFLRVRHGGMDLTALFPGD
jgi:plasmid stabilization system protein ParE